VVPGWLPAAAAAAAAAVLEALLRNSSACKDTTSWNQHFQPLHEHAYSCLRHKGSYACMRYICLHLRQGLRLDMQ
jgi:hypothetical protein